MESLAPRKTNGKEEGRLQHCYFVGEETYDVKALDVTAGGRIKLGSHRVHLRRPVNGRPVPVGDDIPA